MTATGDAPVEVFRDLVETLDLSIDVDAAATELQELVRQPWTAYDADPARWRSSLTDSGAPFELSLKLDSRGGVSVRYVVDRGDPGASLAANRGRYLESAVAVTAQPGDVLESLFGCHLADAPDSAPPTLMHGVGWALGNRRRSSLYFPAPWLEPDELAARLPGPTQLPGPAQVVGYDFEATGLASWKTYHWLSVDPTRPLAEHPDLAEGLPSAAAVHDRFAANVPPVARPRATFLQRKNDATGSHDRLFFFTRPWGWGATEGMSQLLGLLASVVDLSPLQAVGQCSRRHGLPLHIGLVSVGGTDEASATIYLWPS